MNASKLNEETLVSEIEREEDYVGSPRVRSDSKVPESAVETSMKLIRQACDVSMPGGRKSFGRRKAVY